MYPALTPKEREHEYLKEHRTVFIMQIGDVLKSGARHDGRAPDYDDWKLNGDIMFWNDILQCAFEYLPGSASTANPWMNSFPRQGAATGANSCSTGCFSMTNFH